MSSHHIIRENQEPAILIIQPEEVSEHIINSLLEWSPTVICTEEALPYILQKWIKIDALVVYDPTLNWKDILAYQWPVDIIEYEKFPFSVIQYLESKSIDILNCIVSFGKVLESNWLKDFDEVHLDVFSGHYRYHYINSGKFEKWMSPGRGIYLHTDQPKAKIRTQNILNLEDHQFKVEREGPVSVEADGPLWVGEVVL